MFVAACSWRRIVKLPFHQDGGERCLGLMAKHPLHRDTTTTVRGGMARSLQNEYEMVLRRNMLMLMLVAKMWFQIGCCNGGPRSARTFRHPLVVSRSVCSENSTSCIDSSSILLLWRHLRARNPVLHHSLPSTSCRFLALLFLAFDNQTKHASVN